MDESRLELSQAERLLAETLAAHGRSPRMQETYTLMLRLFAQYLQQMRIDKALDAVTPEDVEAYQRYLVKERGVGGSACERPSACCRAAAAGRAGIRKGVSFHSLRHAFATHLLIPKQTLWAEAQEALLLRTAYFQVVTIPGELHLFFHRGFAASSSPRSSAYCARDRSSAISTRTSPCSGEPRRPGTSERRSA